MNYGDERTPVSRVVAERKDGKILVLRKREMGKWELPGGKIEEGEDRFEGGSRELLEETGLHTGEFTDLVRVEIEDENGCANAYIMHTRVSGDASAASEEHDEYRWVSRSEYPELDFHYHSAYSVPAIGRLDSYLEEE